MEALETIEMLRRELHMHQNQLVAERETITGLQQKVVDLSAECERLLKADLKKEVRTLRLSHYPVRDTINSNLNV